MKHKTEILLMMENHLLNIIFPGGSIWKKICQPMQVMWEMPIQSLSGEDPLEKGMATHSSILAWRMPWTEEPAGLQSMGWQREVLEGDDGLHITAQTELSAMMKIFYNILSSVAANHKWLLNT